MRGKLPITGKTCYRRQSLLQEDKPLVEVVEDVCEEVIVTRKRSELEQAESEDKHAVPEPRQEVEEELCQEVIVKKKRDEPEDSEEEEQSLPSQVSQPSLPSQPTEVQITFDAAPERRRDSDEEALELQEQQRRIEQELMHVQEMTLEDDEVKEEAEVFTREADVKVMTSTPPPSPLSPLVASQVEGGCRIKSAKKCDMFYT